MSEASKFSAVLRQRRAGEAFEEKGTEENEQPVALIERKKRGRPRGGKRSNPEYEQTTLYISRALHTDVKVALVRDGRHDFSDLVEELLEKWVKSRRLS